ncbi:hypothetical protein PHISP_03921, partial [Aspergillus sp. HF37]
FLRLTHVVSASASVLQHCPQSLLLPFYFNVPNTVYGLDKGVYLGDREECLPPSVSLISDAVHSTSNLFVCGECNISYHVRARLITTTNAKCTAETSRPVIFVPAHDSPSPPLCVSDFPSEFALDSALSVSSRAYRFLPFRNQLDFSLHTDEPPPLQLQVGRDKIAFTTVRLRLLCFYPKDSCSRERILAPPPAETFFVVDSTLQASTFFSVVPQDALPKQGDAESSQLALNKTTVCPTQTRKLRFSSWEPVTSMDDHEDKFDDNNKNDDKSARGWQSNATLIYTYERDDYLVPTFACTYASRRYSLSMLLRMDGYGDAKFRLRVPLQIISVRTSDALETASQSDGICQRYTDGAYPDEMNGLPPVYTK